jgi:hypothetical protein
VKHIENTWSDASIAGFDEIVGVTNADVSQLSSADLAQIVGSVVNYDRGNKARLAICVNSELAYGLGRMFSMMRETHSNNSRTVKVFKDIDTA